LVLIEDTDSYVEFVGLTKVRRGTEDGLLEKSEEIINDIVAMDATFDAYELPDFSKGFRDASLFIIFKNIQTAQC